MPTVAFTPALARFIDTPTVAVEATTLRDALAAVFARHPALRGYLLDDQGALRRHVAIFVNGEPLKDRRDFGDALAPADEIYVFQALSGG